MTPASAPPFTPLRPADGDALLRHADWRLMYGASRPAATATCSSTPSRTVAFATGLSRSVACRKRPMLPESALHYQPRVDMKRGRVLGAEGVCCAGCTGARAGRAVAVPAAGGAHRPGRGARPLGARPGRGAARRPGCARAGHQAEHQCLGAAPAGAPPSSTSWPRCSLAMAKRWPSIWCWRVLRDRRAGRRRLHPS